RGMERAEEADIVLVPHRAVHEFSPAHQDCDPNSDRQDPGPAYAIGSVFFENGVNGQAIIDYGAFAIKGKLMKIDFLKCKKCKWGWGVPVLSRLCPDSVQVLARFWPGSGQVLAGSAQVLPRFCTGGRGNCGPSFQAQTSRLAQTSRSLKHRGC